MKEESIKGSSKIKLGIKLIVIPLIQILMSEGKINLWLLGITSLFLN